MSLQFRSRAILVIFLMAFTTNIFAISSGCFYGRPDGVSYNTVWHDAQWSYYDVNSSFDTAYMVIVVDGPKPGQRNDNFPAGAGAEVTHYLNEPLDGSYDIEGEYGWMTVLLIHGPIAGQWQMCPIRHIAAASAVGQ